MAAWFRSWHGAPTDTKWLLIARKSGAAPAIVSAIAWALFDHASQHEERGTVSDFDAELYSVWAEIDESIIVAVIDAMIDKGVIVDGVLSAWEKRQPKREDNSTDRVREFRARQKSVTEPDSDDETHCNADETHGNNTEVEVEQNRTDTEQNRTEAEGGAREALPAAAVETAEVLRCASWIGGDVGAIADATSRAFSLVPEFNQSDGPLEAEKFVRYHAKKPPRDWYRAYLNWIKNAVRYEAESTHNGRASPRQNTVVAGMAAVDRVGEMIRQMEHQS